MKDVADLEREAVRVVLIDVNSSVLLLQVRDAQRQDLMPWWELPGGGFEPGETPTQVAVRELAEETGLQIDPEQVTPPMWFRSCTYRHRGRRVLQHEVIVVARIGSSQPTLGEHRRTPTETEDIIGWRWWNLTALQVSDERFFPGTLPQHIGKVLTGQTIVEDFEVWD